MEKILDERFWSKPADGKRIKYVKTQSSKNRKTGCVCGRCCKEKIMKSIYSWLSSQSLEFNIDKDIKSVGVFNIHIESSNTLIDYNDRAYFTKGNRSTEQFKRF